MSHLTTPLSNILFLDIETVPAVPNYEEMSDNFKKHWDKKADFFCKEDDTPESIYQRAGIYAEFGKIICISVGLIIERSDGRKFRVKSFFGDDEKQLLLDFSEMLREYTVKANRFLCGHNIKEFDVPYIARRMLVNGIRLPEVIDIAGKKPWEVHHFDTMELWKFGDYKHFTSLDLLTALFDIPTPKDDIDGSMVAEVYYNEKNLERIVRYCEKDVLAVAQLMLRYRGEGLLPEGCMEVAE
ncbi:MAG: 3'-5' exonuclease [Bacteroidales bacterium]|jgi:DNA polymerase elongation subunit (family B)|nr:3'-5' exonuclease [Bacteroidales bacterium]MDD4236512.1 3'-5' exonuclease [Bacteroidales bacterium]MDY0161516.1 3'-5' exonuclease [Bacteroidales bacterium]